MEEAVWNELDLEVGKIPILFKMHGSADPASTESGCFLITEDDYVKFLARMSSNMAIPSVFAETFQKSHFLFLGYGLHDWNLRVILYKIWERRPEKKYGAWAIQYRAQELEQVFWSMKKLHIFEMSIDEFVAELAGSQAQHAAF